jgi:hypothetical protein
LQVLKFLEVADDGRLNFPLYNPASAFRYPRLQRIAYPALQFKDRLGLRGLGVWTSVENLMRVERPREPLTPEMLCACSLQHRELMAQDNKFQQEVKALAEPRPHCRKPSKDPSRHEL